jgi:integrase
MVASLLTSTAPVAVRLCCAMGYAFMLRYSEVVGLVKGENIVRKTAAGYLICLRRSKSDRKLAGVSVFFSKQLVPVWLATAVDTFNSAVAGKGGMTNHLTVNNPIRTVLNDTDLTFHCLRHGRTTDLHGVGVDMKMLKELGRWSSTAAVTCYLHH